MKRISKLTLFGSLIFIFSACNDLSSDQAQAQIFSILKNERVAHLTGNAGLFISEFADTTYQVSNGNINYVTKEKTRAHFAGYFNSTKILKWGDIQAPVVRFSKDKTMAYAIVKKMVITELSNNNRIRKKDTTVFAWVSIFNKIDHKWRLTCNVSTNK